MLGIFYRILNFFYHYFFGSEYLLHVPLFLNDRDSIFQGQLNLADHCLSYVPDINGKVVLDVGCGNGRMSKYIFHKYHPAMLTGVDLVGINIRIADRQVAESEKPFLKFAVDDAQRLATIADNTIDVLICIESALHYPDKLQFLSAVHRVLRPGGLFVIADLLKVGSKSPGLNRSLALNNWTTTQYRRAFVKSQFSIAIDTELHQLLEPSINQLINRSWKDIRAAHTVAAYFLFPMVYPFLAAYVYFLNKNFRYHLFIGKKN